ncbi:MAG: hypothetical protein UT30_C0019G0031 [Candidatus Uhrbacteria bacterium GW2011_GWF2_39_13]|uniref:Uncharacterized protein n=1 Tax=Candidatus Uhrbacteria bacterium GW2011_GWF2_39_13 TaxID=1618995 RepID=A0A0G0Q075_9BACT|nr:MAG: hypothetical protein UT30_C0019G0031 [Candidatus Uhrbacteria bacterium GW2011_GWF2_39_13]HAU66204.1 hypothetical protein [Candidatus Uhrbacteria bacterium]
MKTLFQKSWFIILLSVLIAILLLISSLVYVFIDSLSTSSSLKTVLFGRPEQTDTRQQATSNDTLGTSYPVLEEEFPPYVEEVIAYEYVYEDELPDLSTLNSNVYRRINTSTLPASVSKNISQLTLAGLSLSAFDQLNIQNLNLSESDENGYNVSVDLLNNTFSVSRNPGYWQTVPSIPLSKENIPSNETLIATAETFLTDYKIDRSRFGKPSIDQTAFNTQGGWFPESITVNYPLLIQEQEVWSMWGQPSGLSVSINLHSGEVDSFFGPGPQTQEISNKELITDTKQVLAIAKRGGLWDSIPENPDKTFTSRLGTPEFILAEHYQYENDTVTSSILYVPALRFPVIETDPNTPHQRSWVIVPLVKDVLTEANPNVFPWMEVNETP